MKPTFSTLLLGLGLFGCTHAIAAGAADTLAVSNAYVRAAPPGAPATAAFMVLRNSGNAPIRLVKADSTHAGTAELHTHRQEDGMMKMRQVPEIAVPAGGEVELKPGGLHVMLIGPKADLKEGDSVSLTLGLSDGSSKALSIPVRGGAPMMHRH